MHGDPFGIVPIWAVFVITLALVLLSVEFGYRWAHKQRRSDLEKEAPVGAMVGATLGLLAFLLAITFGLAADRFHDRREALLREVNAIRNTYLRSQIMVEPYRTEVRKLLREYVDERLRWAGMPDIPAGRTVKELQDRIWEQAVDVGRQNPGQEVVSLFIDSANDVLGAHAERVARQRSSIHGPFWAVLYVLTFLGMAAMGYHGGVAGTSRSPVMVAVAIAFSAVIVLIVDIDRPGEGVINVSQRPMMDLKDSMAGDKNF